MPSLLVVVMLLTACRGSTGDDGVTIDAVPTIDAPDGVGCTTRTPRMVEPEAFVGPTGLQSRITTAIDAATTTLDVQMYLFTVQPIADRIIAAHQRGIAVRILLDPDEAGNNNTRPRFMSAGIPTRNVPPLYTYAHAKYLVIDGTAAIIMSMNFNADAMDLERNYGFVDKDPEDVADVAAIFAMDWAAAAGETPRPANLACTRLVVSPDNAKVRVIELVNSATSTLELEVLYLTETNVRLAIGAAKNRGVAVRVMTTTPSTLPDDTTTYMHQLGIPIKWSNDNDFLLHAKLVMADGAALVGSQNMSQTSLQKNREVGGIIFEPTQFAKIHAQFEADWIKEVDAP